MPTSLRETRFTRAAENRAAAIDRRLVEVLAAGRGRHSVRRVVVVVLCGAVHLVTLAFVAAAIWALWPGTNVEHKVLGVLCLLVAFALRPTFPRATKGAGLVDPEKAPATHALVAEIAAAIGAPMPTRLEVFSRINATASLTGLRGRTVGFGAPLWAASSGQARIAVLAHELGHFANGDPLHGRYVSGALQTLDHWLSIFTPVNTSSASLGHGPTLGRRALMNPGIQRVIFWPVRVVLTGYAHVISLVAAPDHRRAEALADLCAARAAGTDGAVDALEVTLATLGIEVAVNRAAVCREDPAPALQAFREAFDADRRAGVRRSGAAEKSRMDAEHPLTCDRLRLLESSPRMEATVTRTPEEWAAIEAEWARPVASRLTALAESMRYRR